MATNHRVVLKSRPGADGFPTNENFAYEECSYPANELSPGEILVKTLYISVDPAMRCCMNEDTGVQYLQPWQLGEAIQGTAGIGVVLVSCDDRFQTGDIITRALGWPWQNFAILRAESDVLKVDTEMTGARISLVLSCLGLIGLTSLIGIREKGGVKSDAYQTFVVSGAAGACGTIAGQIARLEGCNKVVGICGTDEKCRILLIELGFDFAINYNSEQFATTLKDACPSGIDIYFDNVGGTISDEVISLMNRNGRVILCGQISQYNKDVPYPPPIEEKTLEAIRVKNIDRERFLVLNYVEKFPKALEQLAVWLKAGKLQVLETIEEGLENAGKAFVQMMSGGNIGKQIVHIADV